MSKPARRFMSNGWIVFWTVAITLGVFTLAYAAAIFSAAVKWDS